MIDAISLSFDIVEKMNNQKLLEMFEDFNMGNIRELLKRQANKKNIPIEKFISLLKRIGFYRGKLKEFFENISISENSKG